MHADEKVCPRCAETVKQAAVVCRFCGHEFSSEERAATSRSEPEPSTWLPTPPRVEEGDKAKNANKTGQAALGCLGIVVLLAIGGQLVGLGNDDRTTGTAAALDSTNNAAPITAFDHLAGPDTDWIVSTRTDQVRGKPVHQATVTSENEVDFDFPYAGGSRLTMTVRKHPAYGDDVIFQISDGQFVCGIYDCKGAINFGNGAETLTLSTPEDHDSKTLFATYGSAIIKKLKSSEQVIVELPFYQEGNRQFTFKTNGLVWPPKS